MIITFKRTQYTKASTVSELLVDSKQIGWGLEDVVRPASSKKIWGQTAIPAGRYQCVITWSPKFQRKMPLLLGVPGYEGVRVHWGNDATASEGCLLVGSGYNMKHPDWISESRKMFDKLYSLIESATQTGRIVWVDVINTQTPLSV